MNAIKESIAMYYDDIANTASLAIIYTSGSSRHPEHQLLLSVDNGDNSRETVLVFPSTEIPPECFGMMCLRQKMPEELQESVYHIYRRLVWRHYRENVSDAAVAMIYMSMVCATALFHSNIEEKGYRWIPLYPHNLQHIKDELQMNGRGVSEKTFDTVCFVAQACQS